MSVIFAILSSDTSPYSFDGQYMVSRYNDLHKPSTSGWFTVITMASAVVRYTYCMNLTSSKSTNRFVHYELGKIAPFGVSARKDERAKVYRDISSLVPKLVYFLFSSLSPKSFGNLVRRKLVVSGTLLARDIFSLLCSVLCIQYWPSSPTGWRLSEGRGFSRELYADHRTPDGDDISGSLLFRSYF